MSAIIQYIKAPSLTFSDIKQGEFFLYVDFLYLKTEEGAVCLQDGEFYDPKMWGKADTLTVVTPKITVEY